MTSTGEGHVYATLLLSDSYLPGALVLAHSLRDAGTSKQLAVLVTLDSVSADSIAQLKTVYDHVFPVPRIRNDKPANLHLMNRPDLHSAFTKINLWKQGQFSRIVYIDADVVAYRAPDELFNLPHAFAAAPDIGWPDLFNTGVMVLSPNMGDYYAMMAMAERGISFDGADQGLLNMHFGNTYHRLPFTYNVTPSAHYQYIPAYRHFQSSINMVHFIGAEKPWFSDRGTPHGTGPFDEMIGRWWAVYDRHYRAQEPASKQAESISTYSQTFTQDDPESRQPSSGEQHHHGDQSSSQQDGNSQSSHPQHFYTHSAFGQGHSDPQHGSQHRDPFVSSDSSGSASGTDAEARSEQQVPSHDRGGAPAEERKPEPRHVAMSSWDAQWQPPPQDSQPEALNFPATHYEMSRDTAPFVPPVRYPSPPKNMWYEVPKEPPAPAPRSIFPWEGHQPRPSRSFRGGDLEPPPSGTPDLPGERHAAATSGTHAESSTIESNTSETKSEPSTPKTSSVKSPPSDSWTSYSHVNAWDDVPEIGRYVEGLQKHRRGKSQDSIGGAQGLQSPAAIVPGNRRGGSRMRGFKLTDFPSEVERPSLPVTPAPIHRNAFWGGAGDADDSSGDGSGSHGRPPLPAADGVPAQAEWLQKLAKQQSEALLRRLGANEGDAAGEGADDAAVGRHVPVRSMPFGSESLVSPTYHRQTPATATAAAIAVTTAPTQPAPALVSPQPVKTTGLGVLGISEGGEPTIIADPSYAGPSAAWEKGEDVPSGETPLPPSEAEKDVLET